MSKGLFSTFVQKHLDKMRISIIKAIFMWLLRIRYRKGYGMQSPFAYSFFRDIIFEELPFYMFDRLESLKDKHLTRHTCRMLFRIVNMLSPHVALDIAPVSAAPVCYEAAVSARTRTIALVDDDVVGKEISDRCAGLDILSEVRNGNILKNLMVICEECANISYAHVNCISDSKLLKDVIMVLINKMPDKSVIVMDGIHLKEVKNIWKLLVDDEKVSVSFDLYSVGIVFMDKSYSKHYYKVSY